jgi:hypothetical protein
MSVIQAELLVGEASDQFYDLKNVMPRRHPDRRLSPSDLLEFGRCPWRWAENQDPEDPLAEWGPTLVERMAFTPSIVQHEMVRRPDTYEVMKLECPKCGSEGPAEVCTKCGQRRRNVVRPRPWS